MKRHHPSIGGLVMSVLAATLLSGCGWSADRTAQCAERQADRLAVGTPFTLGFVLVAYSVFFGHQDGKIVADDA